MGFQIERKRAGRRRDGRTDNGRRESGNEREDSWNVIREHDIVKLQVADSVSADRLVYRAPSSADGFALDHELASELFELEEVAIRNDKGAGLEQQKEAECKGETSSGRNGTINPRD